MTQLPAAGQLAGDPRRLVQQLITDFNEMLTMNAEWRASYEKVDATLDELLAPRRRSRPRARRARSERAARL